MAFHTADAILLDVRDLQEKDRIVAFLTRERGKVRGVARSARRKYSRFAGQLQPLAKARVTWMEKEGRDLVRITGVELVRPAAKLQEDLESILLGSYMVEHVLELVQENESGDLFFRLLDSTLEALAAGVDRDLAARYFEAWALRLAGVFPPPDACPLCDRPFEGTAMLAPAGGALVCTDCAAGERGFRVGADVLDFLRRIGRRSLTRLGEEPPPPATLAAAGELAARVRRDFLQRELKSHRVMERTLGPRGMSGRNQ